MAFGDIVQDDVGSYNSTTGNQAFGTPVTLNNLIVVSVHVGAVSPIRTVTVTDQLGNDYGTSTPDTSLVHSTDTLQGFIFHAKVTNAGTPTITVAISGAAAIVAWTQTEIEATNPTFDVAATPAQGTNAAPTTGAASNGVAASFVFASCIQENTSD